MPVMAQDIGWMEAHKQNSIRYAECRLQHQVLVEAVESRQND